MNWEAIYAEERAKAMRKFDAAVRAAKRHIARTALGDENHETVRRALDGLWRRADAPEIRGHRETADACYETIRALRVDFEAAREAGLLARQESRNAELARLREEHRASLPLPGSYEAELYLASRGGR